MSFLTRWRLHWSRLEPGTKELRLLCEASNLEVLCAYLEEPGATPGLRRRATSWIAEMTAGDGVAGVTGATDPAVIPVLVSLSADEDPVVRRNAAFGLSRTGDAAAAGALLHALSDVESATRIHGILGLGRLRWRPAIEPLSRLLDDSSCRRCAAEALVKIGDGRAIRPLWTAALAAESRRARKQLETAAKELEAGAGFAASG